MKKPYSRYYFRAALVRLKKYASISRQKVYNRQGYIMLFEAALPATGGVTEAHGRIIV